MTDSSFQRYVDQCARELSEEKHTKAVQRAIWIDETADFTPRQWRRLIGLTRHAKARSGWFNWYVNRGRLDLDPSRKDLRMVSHRRCL